MGQWGGHPPADWKISGSIPSQGTCLDRGRARSLVGGACEATGSCFLSLSFFLPSPLSKQIN